MKTIALIMALLSFALSDAQDLEPTSSEALVNITTVSGNGEARPNEKVLVASPEGESWIAITDNEGSAKLLIPKGKTYRISYTTLQGEVEYSEIEIPSASGKVQFDLRLEFEQPKVFTLKNLNFETGSAVITSSSYPYLDQLIELMTIKGSMTIEIGGHTDNVGDPEKNQALSEKRAKAVQKYLIQQGIPEDRVIAVGYGQTKPTASNESPEGRTENRRTEVTVIKE